MCPELASAAPRPWRLCACPAERRTARHQPSAHRRRRPTARRPGLPSPRRRGAAAATPRHPPSSSAAPSPPSTGFPGQLTQHQYVVGTFSLTQIGQTSCFSRSSPISDGILAQPKQARLIATFDGTPPLSATGGAATVGGAAAAGDVAAAGGVEAAGGGAAAASLASLSAFSVVSASRTSLLPAPRSSCCARSLASRGLGPSSGLASHSPRTASRRPSAMDGQRAGCDPHGLKFGEERRDAIFTLQCVGVPFVFLRRGAFQTV
eukprot:scaffold61741_cov63-Phaeocystis_antarctica.AAC.6